MTEEIKFSFDLISKIIKKSCESVVFITGVRVTHRTYGLGIILGNKHKRKDGFWYWHVAYDDGTFGYNRENSLTIV